MTCLSKYQNHPATPELEALLQQANDNAKLIKCQGSSNKEILRHIELMTAKLKELHEQARLNP